MRYTRPSVGWTADDEEDVEEEVLLIREGSSQVKAMAVGERGMTLSLTGTSSLISGGAGRDKSVLGFSFFFYFIVVWLLYLLLLCACMDVFASVCVHPSVCARKCV